VDSPDRPGEEKAADAGVVWKISVVERDPRRPPWFVVGGAPRIDIRTSATEAKADESELRARARIAQNPGMLLEAPRIEGRLIRRYKRFLADVELPDGSIVTAHCPNTGGLIGCQDEGSRVWLRDSMDPKRKLRFTWQAIEIGETWVNVDTNLPNRVVHDAVASGQIPALRGYDSVRREVKYGKNSRIDLKLEAQDKPPCFVEVKSTTLVEGRRALFPDAVTERGKKHLEELMGVVRAGERAVQFFFVNRDDVTGFRPADAIDPAYCETLRRAAEAGVEVMAWCAHVAPDDVQLVRKLRVDLSARKE